MDKKTINKIWREVARGAPDGVPTAKILHDFAQRVEELTISRLYYKHEPLLKTYLAFIVATKSAP